MAKAGKRARFPTHYQVYGSNSGHHLHHVHTAGVSAGHLGVGGGNQRRNPTVAPPPTEKKAARAGGGGNPKSPGGTEITTETEFVTSTGTDEW